MLLDLLILGQLMSLIEVNPKYCTHFGLSLHYDPCHPLTWIAGFGHVLDQDPFQLPKLPLAYCTGERVDLSTKNFLVHLILLGAQCCQIVAMAIEILSEFLVFLGDCVLANLG